MENVAAVEMKGITKSFGNVKANDNVDLHINKGEILALLGENGSGKTTLMNILAGIYYPDEGQIFINGEEVNIASPKDAYDLGIGMIHQHFKLVDVLTVAENIVLGIKDGSKHDMKQVKEKINDICKQYGFLIDLDQKIYDLSVSQKQTVEIVKVLYRGADILILDEPTAVLTPQETKKLFTILKKMKEDGKAIVIITHKMNEVLELSDRVTILRKGEYIGDLKTSETDTQQMTDMMVGHAVSLNINRDNPVNMKPRIRLEHVYVRDQNKLSKLLDISFTINAGETLGIAGISGNGQKELLEAIAGLQPIEKGTITYYYDDGREENIVGKNPFEIAQLGVTLSFVPEDRLGMGLVGSMDLTDNMMLRSYRAGNSIFTNRKSPRNLAQRIVDELQVVTPGLNTPISRLSGGNIQKMLVGREISNAPKVLLTAYADRGLDINSSYTIYDLINTQKRNGVAVVYVGENLDVLLQLCDTIVVLCSGEVSGIVNARKVSKQTIGLLMTRVGG